MKTRMKKLISILLVLTLALAVEVANAVSHALPPGSIIIDDLEDIGTDGTPVSTRTIGGVTVTISTSVGTPLKAGTYFLATPTPYEIFWGPSVGVGIVNDPLTPGNVSGSRFIGHSDIRNLGNIIIFDFSLPVFSFGLTTVDLLEQGESSTTKLSLRALGASSEMIDEQTRTGPQGGSGLDLDWVVSSSQPNITRVLLVSSGISYGRSFGIDDLSLTPIPPLVEISVNIDIKPGSFPNSINPDSKGVIPVAILSTDDFDASTVEPTTVGFGPCDASPVHWALEDVDGDGDLDMIFHFKTQETGISDGDTEATLTGETTDGIEIIGTDSVRTVPLGKK